MDLYHRAVVVLVGATLFAVTWWLSQVWLATLGIKLGHLEVLAYVPGWFGALHHLAPGMVVGAMSAAFTIRHAIAAVVLGSIAVHVYLVWVGFTLEAFSVVNVTCLKLAYASIAAVSGFSLRHAWSNAAVKLTRISPETP
ncbi:MAG: hypothetical protein KDI51_15595 [Xanthomonadales bacterium]|nr:hypothetical protein [Xanthomonadales bacterium]